ncbi:hypothetical protein NM688_g188 [Phlebia brevispora]|uniref:Uncharacterized protein n=1 Tax=Phlebia brevispora TaxID=194682 RepID=A0ACC1TFE4_9APHY|nr:hypothetical protein NM688_g188 [Phlebia brevispora]
MFLSVLQVLLIPAVSWVLWRILRPYVVRSSLDDIPGPPADSLIYGNFKQLFDRHGWSFHDNMEDLYGPIVKIRGMFQKPALYVFDPKALHHIVLTDQNIWERPSFMIASTRLMFGTGLLGVLDRMPGDVHRKQRKMLNPVFSIGHMRSMTPIFYNTAHRLRDAISAHSDAQGKEIDILNWMGRTALELIGQGGLGYSFDPLVTTTHNSYGDSLKALLPTLARCTGFRMFSHHGSKLGPPSLRRFLISLIPNRDIQQLREIVDTMDRQSSNILSGKRSALRAGDEAVKQQVGEGKDIMSILLRANMATSGDDRLSEDELLGQMSTLVFAATDTTSNALARTLNLLAERQDAQDKLRAEILAAGQGEDIPYDQLVDLPYLDAVCRETLRLHSPVSFTAREARRDIVLPFSTPVRATDGTLLNEIVVPKDTLLMIGVRACNRSKALWGEDALEWKPERWLSPDGIPSSVKNAGIPGVYSNLMTFLGGGNSCIGFKFSQLEMKVILAALLSSFKFTLSDKEICWNLADVAYPTVGPISRTPSMPLNVEPVEKAAFI